MLKSILLSCIALGALASSALASDLPTHKGPPPAPTVAPAFSWTGFYGGLNGGYADPTAKLSVAPVGNWIGDVDWGYSNPNSPGVANAGMDNIGLHGFIGGVTAGYNYQINNIVIGAEADADYMNLHGSYATPVYSSVDNSISNGTYWANGSANLNSLFTLRLRAGLAFDRLLVFATGGLAVTDEKFNQAICFRSETTDLPFTRGAIGCNAGGASTTAVTGVVGGGLEYAFDNHWSLKGEYLYVPLKSQSFSSTYVSSGNWTINHHESLTALNVFRAGLNYRF